MNKPEQQFWVLIRSNAPKGIWAQRVENGAVIGMPDVYLVKKNGESVWLELKIGAEPKRDTSRLLSNNDMRTEQINWHLKAASMGLRTYIAVRAQKKTYLLRGSAARVIADMTRLDFQPYECNTWDDFWSRLI